MTSLLMVTRVENGEREAEPVIADLAGTTLALTLDDGVVLILDYDDLLDLQVQARERRAA